MGIKQAKDCKCTDCDKPAIVFYPMINIDIPSYPYCKKCLGRVKLKMLNELHKIDRYYESQTKYR